MIEIRRPTCRAPSRGSSATGPESGRAADRTAVTALLTLMLTLLLVATGCSDAASHRPGSTPTRLPELVVPVKGVERDQLLDSFTDRRGRRRHEAIDILAPRHTPVLAADDGTIVRLRTSSRGGRTIVQLDPSGYWVYSYAHLQRFRRGLRVGERVRRSQVIAFVGTSGNAPHDVPHLHFEVARVEPDQPWWDGTPVNPIRLFAR